MIMSNLGMRYNVEPIGSQSVFVITQTSMPDSITALSTVKRNLQKRDRNESTKNRRRETAA